MITQGLPEFNVAKIIKISYGEERNPRRSNLEITNCDFKPNQIERLIYIIRNQHIMLDRDLASLYGVETRALNQAVKRNIERFPEDFRFRLTKEECLR